MPFSTRYIISMHSAISLKYLPTGGFKILYNEGCTYVDLPGYIIHLMQTKNNSLSNFKNQIFLYTCLPVLTLLFS